MSKMQPDFGEKEDMKMLIDYAMCRLKMSMFQF